MDFINFTTELPKLTVARMNTLEDLVSLRLGHQSGQMTFCVETQNGGTYQFAADECYFPDQDEVEYLVFSGPNTSELHIVMIGDYIVWNQVGTTYSVTLPTGQELEEGDIPAALLKLVARKAK